MNSTPDPQKSEQQNFDIPNKILLRPDEVAEIFDVTIKTVHEWKKAGLLEACQPNEGITRFFRKSVIALLRSRRSSPDL